MSEETGGVVDGRSPLVDIILSSFGCVFLLTSTLAVLPLFGTVCISLRTLRRDRKGECRSFRAENEFGVRQLKDSELWFSLFIGPGSHRMRE